MRWQLARDRQLLVRSWAGQSVVYDCAAGDTHLLGTLAASVLARLQSGPCAAGELNAGIVADLAALGLVEEAA